MPNADRFVTVVGKYTDIQELMPEIVREFIEKIVVHDRSEPYKKRNYTQPLMCTSALLAKFRTREKP